MKKKIIDNKNFEEEDFIVHVRPHMIKDKWSGQVTVNILTSKENPLPEKDIDSLFNLCRMMACVIPMMEEDPEFMYDVQAYAKNFENEKGGLTITNKEGNVIKLDFKSVTKGNA